MRGWTIEVRRLPIYVKGLATLAAKSWPIQMTCLANASEGLADGPEGLATTSQVLANRKEGSGQ